MTTEQSVFRTDFTVRSYECDTQGIVNNSVYFSYLEHARHDFLKQIGVDFDEYTKQGIFLVVIRTEIDYKKSLEPGDEFFITSDCRPVSSLKFMFRQEIYKKPSGQLATKAVTYVTGYNRERRFIIPEQIRSFFAP